MWGAFEEAGQADDDQPTGAGGAGGGKLVRLVAMEGGNGGRKACDASALRTVLQRETRRERFLEPLEPRAPITTRSPVRVNSSPSISRRCSSPERKVSRTSSRPRQTHSSRNPCPADVGIEQRSLMTSTSWLAPMNCGGCVTSSRKLGGSSPLRLVSKWAGALPGLARPGRAMKEQLLRRPERDLNLDRHAGWRREAEDLAGAVVARDRRVPGV